MYLYPIIIQKQLCFNQEIKLINTKPISFSKIKAFLSLFLLLLSFQFSSLAQHANIETLLQLIKTDKEDTSKLTHLNSLANALQSVNPDSSISVAEQTTILVEKLIADETYGKKNRVKILKAESSAYSILGACYLSQAEYTKAIINYQKAIKIYELLKTYLTDQQEIKNTDNIIAKRLASIGVIYFNQGNYPIALDYDFKALKIMEEQRDKGGIAYVLGNIGILYNYQSDYEKALEYLNRALKLQEQQGDKLGIAGIWVNLGIVYSDKKEDYRALDCYIRSLGILEKLGDKNGIATSLINIGSTYTDLGIYPKALEFYNRALKLYDEMNDKNGVAITYGNLGEFYLKTKKYKLAEKYLFDALKLDKETGALDFERQTEMAIFNLFYQTNRYQEALEHYKNAMSIKETMFNNEKNRQLARREIDFEYEKKQAKQKAEQDKKDAVREKERQKQKVITYAISTGLFLVMLLAIFIFRGYRQKLKANIIITRQKEEVEEKNKIIESQSKILFEKNKNITDSINYAKRIQNAKLPKREEILKWFPQSFVLFKPKDIVSGDFYFIHPSHPEQKESVVFIGIADCTGHGVPGAFMSLIGTERLDDAFSQSTHTSEILKHLNIGVKTALKQTDSNESTRDGMDIALCSIPRPIIFDSDNSILIKFAAANRPLWLIKKGASEVIEYDGTKKAIAGFTEDNQHFDTIEIKLFKGDTFYIFTDGYHDQFGGENEKKLMTKKMKEILVSIQHQSMAEQEKYLNDFIKQWKAGLEQVDDILVMGIRV